MIYKNTDEIRCRLNEIARIINEARDYGRRPLPKKFDDFQREWDELHSAYLNSTWYSKGETIEIEEAVDHD